MPTALPQFMPLGNRNGNVCLRLPDLSRKANRAFTWCFLLCPFLALAAAAQQAPMPQMGAPPGAVENLPRPIEDTMDRLRLRDMRKDPAIEKKTPPADEGCLLPPLSRLRSPVVAATALAVPSNAQYEYAQACVAIS